jgi:hypothetical protein
MPFITEKTRAQLAGPVMFGLQPGDKCFLYYVAMMRRWGAERRWTTADALKAWVKTPELREDLQRAKELAWEVFFHDEVMPYEREMKTKNGAVTGEERVHPWVYESLRYLVEQPPATPEALNEEGKQ